MSTSSDPLSFLDKKTDPLSFLEKKKQDPLSFLKKERPNFKQLEAESTQKLLEAKPLPGRENLLEYYLPEEKTPEELKAMPLEERRQYAEDLNRAREYQQSKGFIKGTASGLTLSASEYIPGLKPEEDDLLLGLGNLVGSYLPISGMYNLIGKPLVNLALKSPVAKEGLAALARLTGFGLTGAAHKGASDLIQGEIPKPEELLETGAEWAAIDAVLQTLGVGIVFQKAVKNIAQKEGISAKEVLSRLWKSTKNFFKEKILPEKIGEPEVEVLMKEAEKAEAEGLSKETEIEVKPEKISEKEVEVKKPEEVIQEVKEKSKIIDERPLLKEISDLKEKYKNKKSESLKRQIKNKVYELEDIRDENKKYEKELNKKVEKPDISKKGLESQKNFILNSIEEALSIPPDSNYVVIDVPGDGTFKINNEPRMLENFADKIRKSWPKGKTEKKISKAKKEKPLELSKKRQSPSTSTRPRRPVIGKQQAVARSKIIKTFRKAFKDPIRLGKISQRNALGIHKLWSKVTRLLHDNDIETAAHEIGHNLHTILYGGNAKTPQEQVKNISKALQPFLDELKPLAHYEPWGMEGFAEFTRLYVTNPKVAQQLAPKFYQKFEADLDALYPELKNALLESRDYYEQYLQGTPQSRIRAQIAYKDNGLIDNLIESIKSFNMDKIKTQFLDDVYPAKRLVAEAFGIPISEVENLKDDRNLYKALRVLKGAIGKGDVFILHETFNPLTLDKINGSLRDILKQLPNEEAVREFNDYLVARRAIEKAGQNISTGIELGDAIQVEKDFTPKYESLAKELDKYNDTLLNYAKDAGLLSKEQYQEIKKNNLMYVPFQRDMGKEGGGSVGKTLQAGKPIKRMKGSTRDIIPPLESIVKNTYSIIINSEKNLAGQTLAKLATMKNTGLYVERVPTPIKVKGKIAGEQVARDLAKRFLEEGLDDLIEYDEEGRLQLREDIADAIPEVFLRFGAGTYPPGENIITVYQEGKPTYYEVTPDLYEMWTKGTSPYVANLLVKILRIPARTLRAGAILNPKFIQKNFIRDTWGSWLFTKYGKSIKDPVGLFIDTMFSPLSMMAVSAKQGSLYVEWLKSGGGMSTMQSLDRDSVVKKLDEVRNGYKPYEIKKWLRFIAEISEEANRLSEFGKALEVEGRTRLGRETAAFAARDLSIDFAKIGVLTKVLNQIIPFYNAVIQGGEKLFRTAASDKDRAEFIYRILSFIALPSMMLWWLNKDDERVDELYEEEKDFNFIVSWGSKLLKIPVPFETGVIAHGLTRRMMDYFMKKDPEAFEGFMGSIISAMWPGFTPAFAGPFMETWANKNFFTGSRIIPRAKEDLIAKYQYKDNSSTTARLLGRAIAYMIGQDTRSKAASPAIIDHFINSWTGGLGRLTIKISDAALEAVGLGEKIPGPSQSILERLELDAFSRRFPTSSTKSIEKFYDNYADATVKRKSYKHAEKNELESPEEIEASYERYDSIYDYKSLQAAYKAMQASQREINNIYHDSSIDPDLKRQLIDDLYLQQIQFAKAANEDIKKKLLSSKS